MGLENSSVSTELSLELQRLDRAYYTKQYFEIIHYFNNLLTHIKSCLVQDTAFPKQIHYVMSVSTKSINLVWPNTATPFTSQPYFNILIFELYQFQDLPVYLKNEWQQFLDFLSDHQINLVVNKHSGVVGTGLTLTFKKNWLFAKLGWKFQQKIHN